MSTPIAPQTATAAVAATLAFSATVASARAKRLCDTPLASSLQPAPDVIQTQAPAAGVPQFPHTEEAA
jgi:hypothetical protein